MHPYGFPDDGVTWTGAETGQVPVSLRRYAHERRPRPMENRSRAWTRERSNSLTNLQNLFRYTRGVSARCFSFIRTLRDGAPRTARERSADDVRFI